MACGHEHWFFSWDLVCNISYKIKIYFFCAIGCLRLILRLCKTSEISTLNS